MAELGALTRHLLSLVRDRVDEHVWAQRVCTAYVDVLDVDGAAISVLTATPAHATLWASDPTARLIEELQFELNEGACMEAATDGVAVLVPDVATSVRARRWPIFTAAVVEQTDVGALFALPLRWGAINLGVLDLYRTEPGPLADHEWRDALSAADTAALILLGSRTDPGDGSWLDLAGAGRAEIHQATGMVMAQLGIRPEDALARLRAVAYAQQRLLLDVARDVVSRRRRFDSDRDGEWT